MNTYFMFFKTNVFCFCFVYSKNKLSKVTKRNHTQQIHKSLQNWFPLAFLLSSLALIKTYKTIILFLLAVSSFSFLVKYCVSLQPKNMQSYVIKIKCVHIFYFHFDPFWRFFFFFIYSPNFECNITDPLFKICQSSQICYHPRKYRK